MPQTRVLPLLLAIGAFWPATPASQAPQSADARRLTCEAFFPGMTREDLVTRYGDDAVTDALLPIGEGMSQPGTNLFAGTSAHLDVFWNERPMMGGRTLTSVVVRAPGSAWSSAQGITIGTDLETLEEFNGGPFRLMGFGWDYEGTTMNWSGGRLASSDTAQCRVRYRLRPGADDDRYDIASQVLGAREYSSSHPAMQEINPTVYEMWLEIGRF